MSHSSRHQFGGDDDDEIAYLESLGDNLNSAQAYRLEFLRNTRGGGYRKRKLLRSKKSKKSKRHKKRTRRRQR